MAESPRALELRREIAEMEAHRDHLHPAMTETMLASLREDLAEALGEAAEAPARPQVRPGPSPIPIKTIPAAAAAQEMPMPRKTPPPAERLEVLRKRLAGCSNRKAEGLARMAIRKHCEAHGLPVPPEAAIVRDSCPRKFRKGGAAKVSGSNAPEDLASKPIGIVLKDEGPTAALRLRALRSQALELLPELEDLSAEAAHLASDEMDLLAQTLVLGGKLIARRSA